LHEKTDCKKNYKKCKFKVTKTELLLSIKNCKQEAAIDNYI